LVELELADCAAAHYSSEVDIVVQNDFYWCFFTGDLYWGSMRESGMVGREF